ncbi:MAG: protein phosphatase 2C domain-containing protein [Propionibacteriaceae bacterium]|nr:serine/threonine-protein phosphatase [Micropruina sp.]HBX79765.1 serine/threonine-protein phosphatase [Propionibacteriaceae bacterium]HBY24588.1 serine/threonine-protein phosphatase [Propionibacteriaceae bacterium]
MASVSIGTRSVVGNVRRVNEDAVYVGENVWAVADGMGGHAAGDVASALAIESVKDMDREGLTTNDVRAALDAGNAAILTHGRRHPLQRGLGTTVTGLAGLVLDGLPRWAIFNIGDSRVYRFADGCLTRITVDHSEVEQLVQDGVITEEQARVHPARHMITRSLGSLPAPEPDLWVLPQHAGERFLLCTDGLTNELTDDEIAGVLEAHDATVAADQLVERALAAGGRDNVSVIVVDVDK